MWLQTLHALGLTDLSDEEVRRYVEIRRGRAATGSEARGLGPLSYALAFLTLAQAVSLVVIAVVAVRATSRLSELNLIAAPSGVSKETLVLTPQARLAAVPERVMFLGQMDGSPRGYPVVLVRPYDKEGVWYVQDVREINRLSNTFEAVLSIGNETTAPGTPFEVVVIVLRGSEKVNALTPGTHLTELPVEPRNRITVVRR